MSRLRSCVYRRLETNHGSGSRGSFTPTAGPVLYVVFELGWGVPGKWPSPSSAGQPRGFCTVPARLTSSVLHEIKKADWSRFGLPRNRPGEVVATRRRDGFGSIASCFHRALGIRNICLSTRRRSRSSAPAAERNRIAPRRHQAGCRCSFGGTTVRQLEKERHCSRIIRPFQT